MANTALDLRQCFQLALVPLAAVVALNILFLLLTSAQVAITSTVARGSSGMLFFVLGLMLLGWAGHRAAKAGMDIGGGAICGAIAGGGSAIINAIINTIVRIVGVTTGLGIPVVALDGGSAAMDVAHLSGFIIGFIIVVIGSFFIYLGVGAVMGAIGALVAKRKSST